jgi:hypothetical protein
MEHMTRRETTAAFYAAGYALRAAARMSKSIKTGETRYKKCMVRKTWSFVREDGVRVFSRKPYLAFS